MASDTKETAYTDGVTRAVEQEDVVENAGRPQKQKPPPIDVTAAQQYQPSDAKTPTNPPLTPGTSANKKGDKEKKIGHRRVNDEGQITYKKIQSSQIIGSIQLGIGYAVGSLASKPERDLLMQDFAMVEAIFFPGEGSSLTPAHHCSDFKFKAYAPVAFRYFRDLFGIQPDDFLLSLCNEPMRELSNPGASGSIFYLTNDDEFIIKTVQHKEAEFLQNLLPGYYMNLNQNPRTLLPKFFGLYCYQCGGKNVRVCVMNNLLPSVVKMHQKYDLKGSTYKRKANKYEKNKPSPTYKDLDFMDHHPEGIFLEADTYNALVKTIQRDCRVLESFKIMDYSLLVGVHNLDQAAREKAEANMKEEIKLNSAGSDETNFKAAGSGLTRSKSVNRQRLAAFSTAMESIQADAEPIDHDEDVPHLNNFFGVLLPVAALLQDTTASKAQELKIITSSGGIPARNAKGERLLLFLGIIDILQSYRLKKKLEHTWKSMFHDGDSVSVHRPGFYALRFQDFMAKRVFKKIPSPLKHSPSKRKGTSVRHRQISTNEQDVIKEEEVAKAGTDVSSPGKEEEDLHSSERSSTAFKSAHGDGVRDPGNISRVPQERSKPRSNTDPVRTAVLRSATTAKAVSSSLERSEVVSISQVTIQTESQGSLMSDTSSSSTSGLGSTIRTLTWTPPHSVEGSTPTHTEGTPSFTESSSSGDIACPTTPVKSLSRLSKGSQPSLGDSQALHETEMTHL